MAKSEQKADSTHPVEALNREIEQRGLVVVEGVNRLPSYGAPYISPHFIIAVSHAGVSRGEYDMHPLEFRRHDFSVVYPSHTILANDSSDDYCVTLVIISSGFYEELRQRFTYGNSHVFHSQPNFHLTDEQYLCICDAVKLLKSVSQLDFRYKKEAIISIIDMLSLMAGEFRQTTDDATSKPSVDEAAVTHTYFNRFYECLVNHYRESREVGFYASQLCLSPKYFGSIIKKETGVTAGEWIGRYIIIRSKTLLRHRPDLSIQQISHELGFEEQNTFSRYFKRETGMSPSEFRKRGA